MLKNQSNNYQNATGKIDYTLMNDYMFHVVLQESESTRRELCASLLHLDPDEIRSADVLNPIVPGKSFDAKFYVLDIKILLDNAAIINLEMQVLPQDSWSTRSLSYLCSMFNNLEKGEDYSQVKPAYHIGILNFSPFPDYPEFYAAVKMTNQKYGYIYNDKFILNVLDLNQIELATEEDKAYGIDYWAKLFKAQTWEDFRMIAKKNIVFEEVGETVFKLNQDDQVRYWCEAREAHERSMLTQQRKYEKSLEEIAERKAEIAEKDSAMAKMQAEIAEKDSAMAKMQAEKDLAMAEIAALRATLAEMGRGNNA